MSFRLGVMLMLLATQAWAAPPAIKIAIVPLEHRPDAAALEHALVDAAKDASLTVVNVANGRLSAKPGAADMAQRARDLAHDTGAQRVLVVDVAKLGDGRVLYLEGLDATGKQVGSTTVPLQHESGDVVAADRIALRGGLVRVLSPARYVGRLQLHVDVAGAEVQIDGKPAGAVAGPLELPVGTHALRVTHPAYRDFLRFVEIEYDKALPIEVALSAYPLAEGEMTERQRKREGKRLAVPWWRSWWALSLSGVIITGVTVGAVFASRPGITSDHSVGYTAPPAP
jgi:hypothetical protein